MSINKFEELTPKELGYMMALAGLLAGNDRPRMHPHDFVDIAIEMVDILFEKIEEQRKSSGLADKKLGL